MNVGTPEPDFCTLLANLLSPDMSSALSAVRPVRAPPVERPTPSPPSAAPPAFPSLAAPGTRCVHHPARLLPPATGG